MSNTQMQIILNIQLKDKYNKSDLLSELIVASKNFGCPIQNIIKTELSKVLIQENELPTIITIDNLSINLINEQVQVNNCNVCLTQLEYKLLSFLILNRGSVVSHDNILRKVWNINPNTNTKTLTVHIKRLRAKLGEASHLIKSIPKVGYVIY